MGEFPGHTKSPPIPWAILLIQLAAPLFLLKRELGWATFFVWAGGIYLALDFYADLPDRLYAALNRFLWNLSSHTPCPSVHPDLPPLPCPLIRPLPPPPQSLVPSELPALKACCGEIRRRLSAEPIQHHVWQARLRIAETLLTLYANYFPESSDDPVEPPDITNHPLLQPRRRGQSKRAAQSLGTDYYNTFRAKLGKYTDSLAQSAPPSAPESFR